MNKVRVDSQASLSCNSTWMLKKKEKLIVDPTVKKVNNPEYRHYLKLWNEEAKPKKENSKDLPKLNQVRSHVLDWNSPAEDLFHS